MERFRHDRWSTGAGESHRSPDEGARRETVVPKAESFDRGCLVPDATVWLELSGGRGTTCVRGVRPCPVSTVVVGNPSVLVRTVFKLLSTAEAAAVFLFASARSRSSIVSCATPAVSGVFFLSRQPRLPPTTRRETAIEKLKRVFID
jgi:hypothetical protein